LQARAGVTLSAQDQSRDARWRFAQHNGEWWYYTPENTWMYQREGQWNQFAENSFQPNPQFSGEFATGYRGVEGGAQVDQYGAADGQYAAQGPVYTLRHDENGREYICDNGQRVYFDEGQATVSGDADAGQPTPAPSIPQDPNAPGADAGVQPTAPSTQPSEPAVTPSSTPAQPVPQ
jgi:hypothetical protein